MMMAVNEQDLNTDLKVYNTVQKSKLPEKREPVFQVLLFVTANHQKRDEFSFKSNLSAVRATQKNEIRSFNLNFQKYEKKTAFKERCDQNLRKIPA